MAKFKTKSIYTFTDELTGEEVSQEEEPTTFKIKIVGDNNAGYEKIMSKANEAVFWNWLKNDGEALVGPLQDEIEGLRNEVNELIKENESLDASVSKAGVKIPKEVDALGLFRKNYERDHKLDAPAKKELRDWWNTSKSDKKTATKALQESSLEDKDTLVAIANSRGIVSPVVIHAVKALTV